MRSPLLYIVVVDIRNGTVPMINYLSSLYRTSTLNYDIRRTSFWLRSTIVLSDRLLRSVSRWTVYRVLIQVPNIKYITVAAPTTTETNKKLHTTTTVRLCNIFIKLFKSYSFYVYTQVIVKMEVNISVLYKFIYLLFTRCAYILTTLEQLHTLHYIIKCNIN